ncbi:ATP-grasp domain-containing protein [Flagellimonas algicola]|uniref:ATP-grasp domain-containing protein n=1 Tax=Flagellimonas algicola TaxID=2583815 RepID=UPI001387450B|nr:ATP-grasp domain-containing protein [Allomuricauda algicola]
MVLIPDAGAGVFDRILYCLAQSKDTEIHVIVNEKKQFYRHSRFIKTVTICPLEITNEELQLKINDLCEKLGIDIILPIQESLIHFLSTNKELLPKNVKIVDLPPSNSLSTVTNKIAFSKHLENNNISGPLSYVTSDCKLSNIENLRFPLLFKPHAVTETGMGKGIVLLKEKGELQKICNEETNNKDGEFLFQEYIAGYDIGCGVLCKKGEIIAHTIQKDILGDKRNFAPVNGIQMIHDSEVLSIVARLMKSLDWNGVAQVDLIYDIAKDRILVLEVNGRYWSTLLASLRAGVNFPSLAIQSALGNELGEKHYSEMNYYNLRGFKFKMRKKPWIVLAFRHIWNHTPIRYFFKDPMVLFAKLISRANSVV